MPYFSIPSLSGEYAETVKPWEYKSDVPEPVLESKTAFVNWRKKPATRHCHYSLFEGLDPCRRISEKGENPPYRLHGIVADYDAVCDGDLLDKLVDHSPTEFPPTWASRSYSGGAHLVWEFREPVVLLDPDHTKHLFKIIEKKLKPGSFLPGFDRSAFFAPHTYFEVGREWRQVCGDLVPAETVRHWMYEAGNKKDWRKGPFPVLPLDKVRAEVDRKWPGRWKGAFEDGSRGVCFWDPESVNPSAAIVRPTGVQCFGQDVGFLPWAQLLGGKFVGQHQAETVGAVIEGVFCDGKWYWHRDPATKVWRAATEKAFVRTLRVDHGVCGTMAKGDTASEVDKVLRAVDRQKFVKYAAPFIHMPSGLMLHDGNPVLNIADSECMTPAPGKTEGWGVRFPWVAELLDKLFDPPEQLDFFLAWWKRFYENGLRHSPVSGHAMFVAGPVGMGKTLLGTGVLATTVGGFTDASGFVLGNTAFSATALSKPLMLIDDSQASSDQRRHSQYSAIVKKIVANKHHLSNEKFLPAGMTMWQGRLLGLLNFDGESSRILPGVEISIMDKLMLLKSGTHDIAFPGQYEIEKILAEELPHVCRWLLDWEVPRRCVGTSRFGVREHHNRQLYNTALQAGSSYSFLELLDDFLKSWKNVGGKDRWEGTATELLADMMADERLKPLAGKYHPNQVSTLLGQLKNRGFDLEPHNVHGKKIWSVSPGALAQLEDENEEESK